MPQDNIDKLPLTNFFLEVEVLVDIKNADMTVYLPRKKNTFMFFLNRKNNS